MAAEIDRSQAPVLESSAVVLEIRGLSAAYGRIQVLWGISLQVFEKEIVSLIGANGAGKSTLLKSIIGTVKPTQGSIDFRGSTTLGKQPHTLVTSGISYVPEGRRLFPTMSTKENLRLGAPRVCADLETRFGKVFTLFPVLKDRNQQAAGTLSGGEQQMVAIGRALMSNPKLLLLDELSFGLSPIMFERVLTAIEAIRDSGVSILMAEQNSERALEVSTRTYVMENGRVEISGRSSDLADNPKVREAYLGLAG
jgi:branched-chain amino acid transport system ATP-binding protein